MNFNSIQRAEAIAAPGKRGFSARPVRCSFEGGIHTTTGVHKGNTAAPKTMMPALLCWISRLRLLDRISKITLHAVRQNLCCRQAGPCLSRVLYIKLIIVLSSNYETFLAADQVKLRAEKKSTAVDKKEDKKDLCHKEGTPQWKRCVSPAVHDKLRTQCRQCR